MNVQHIQPGTATSIIVESPDIQTAYNMMVSLAQRLNCQHVANEPCTNCQRVLQGNAEFLITIGLTNKTSIGIEAVRALTAKLSLKPPIANMQRMVIFNPADSLTLPASNALLKLAEEPPPATIIGFICTSSQTLPATLVSRCQLIRINASQEQSVGIVKNIDTLFSQQLFYRLCQASNLVESIDPRVLIQSMSHMITKAAQLNDQNILNRRLNAIDTYRRYLSAGVNPKTALEYLMIEYN